MVPILAIMEVLVFQKEKDSLVFVNQAVRANNVKNVKVKQLLIKISK